MTDYTTFLDGLLTAAADTARAYFGKVTASVKEDDADQVLTEADTALSAEIIARITAAFPRDGVVDEETGIRRGQSGVVWVVDPIDGTANFAAGSPLYGTMVGVLRDGEPVAAGVALPAFGELYLAEKGAGVTRDGHALTVEHGADLASALVAYGVDGHNPAGVDADLADLRALAPRCRSLRMSNSVFDAVMVATGVYGAYLHRHCRIWDCVAPHLVVTESGGRYTDIAGAAQDYARVTDNFTVLAAAPALHEALLPLLDPLRTDGETRRHGN